MSEIYRASMPTRILAADTDDDGGTGTVKALVSAYDHKYRIGYSLWHTIREGAFADSIAGQPSLPLFWMHGWSATEQPPIGHTSALEETDEGLIIEGSLYLESSETARSVYQAMKAGALREWSIGYDVTGYETDPDDDDHEIVIGGELLEASSVLRGANPQTETLKVAADSDASYGDTTTTFIEVTAIDLSSGADSADGEQTPKPKSTDHLDLSQAWVRDYIRSK